jgi:SulP family sulfate permease
VTVLLLTFFLTIFVDLTVAIQVGVLAGALLFMRRMAEVSRIHQVSHIGHSDEENEAKPDPMSIRTRSIPLDTAVYEVFGSLFFGAIDKYKTVLDSMEKKPRILILRMRSVMDIDSSGLLFLEELLERCRKEGVSLVLSGVRAQPRIAMKKSGFLEMLGEENAQPNIDKALERASKI